MALSVTRYFSNLINVTTNEAVTYAHIPVTEKDAPDLDNVMLSFLSMSKNWIVIFISAVTLLIGSKITLTSLAKIKSIENLLSVLRIVIKTGIGSVISIFLFPILIAMYLIFWILNTLSTLYVKLTVTKSMTKATGMDALWGYDTIKSRSFGYGCFQVDGTPDLKNVIKHFTARLLHPKSLSGSMQFAKLRQILCIYGGYYYWKDDDNFDIRNHIKLIRISDLYPELISQEGITGDDMVCRYLGDHGSELILDGNAPQWDITCLITGESEFYHLFRFHHAIGDGLSFIRLLHEHVIDEPVKIHCVCPVPSLLVRLAERIWSFTLIPYSIALLIYKGQKNPLHGPELSGKKYFIAGPVIPFNVIREIKNRTKTTIHDVLFSAISASLGKNIRKKSYKGSNITLCFPIGFNDPTLELKLENTFCMAMISVPLPTADETSHPKENVLSTLYNMQKCLSNSKQDATLTSLYHLLSTFADIVPALFSRMMFSTSGITIGLTNVPGPPKVLTILHQRVSSLRLYAPDKNPLGMVLTFVTYAGIMRLSLRIDACLVNGREEAEELVNGMGEEIKNLAENININMK